MKYVGNINPKHICEGKEIGKRASYLIWTNIEIFFLYSVHLPFFYNRKHVNNHYLLFILYHTINIRETWTITNIIFQETDPIWRLPLRMEALETAGLYIQICSLQISILSECSFLIYDLSRSVRSNCRAEFWACLSRVNLSSEPSFDLCDSSCIWREFLQL